MLAVEQPQHIPLHQHSLIKRSSSIWRRLSRKSRSRSPPETKTEEVRPAPHKLQKRTTELSQPAIKPMITHLQRIEIPSTKRVDSMEIAPRTPPAQRVTKSAMQGTTPFPNSRGTRTIAWDVFLTPDQVYRLVMGSAPEQMEDKWFVYSEGPDNSGKLKAHFHRSWTGMKIAELFVVIDLKGEGAGKIVGIKWNGSEQTNGMSEEEAKYMISTTCSWVLGVDIEKS